ncbi:hypothetical protein A2473_03610 [candidate division WWE3 bacterium RIFOXYC2_FULL_42_13]|nr:MAG: hypothetical protein A2245_00110 [candidate division WWE3 bacterium RIFOXYA2_FULL_43_12]OGC65660.1 MAG: hypothetical protein A2274_02985 [candidate division WWE3 bacterium RIFOXYA12_FULL_43_11]OGC72664.1 MAG: hypothetical protein A2473_03610 [candidate division WWE3 bacterium RIFOXYC2_FULL_42_13]OGC73967.1 MAG: hypothetical protein A2337_01025 [candidate division WWE3 bacterium RIFOXYB2_FULL_43_9]OGC74347.1 MAG: hypothetical protein A2547_00910 [candidate division WWE3 bacterium RIFOXYD
MLVRVIVTNSLGLSLACNGQIVRSDAYCKEGDFLKTPTTIDGSNVVKIRGPNGKEHELRVTFMRRDYTETENQCVHRIVSANPPLHF